MQNVSIRGFDTPTKISFKDGFAFENFNYAGIVTRILQPVLPIFFTIQFAFLYDGWENKSAFDLKSGLGLLVVGGLIVVLLGGAGNIVVGEAGLFAGLGLEGILGGGEGIKALFSRSI